jgi:hypothetical protein
MRNKSCIYSMEQVVRIYNDENSDFYEVGPDPDGLGCVNIRYNDGDKYSEVSEVLCPPEMALLIAEAIKIVANNMINRDFKKIPL